MSDANNNFFSCYMYNNGMFYGLIGSHYLPKNFFFTVMKISLGQLKVCFSEYRICYICMPFRFSEYMLYMYAIDIIKSKSRNVRNYCISESQCVSP